MNQEYDQKYYMDRTVQSKPFPHTEIKTKRKRKDQWRLSDDLLNWLAWGFIEPDKWRWAFRGVRKSNYRLKSRLDRIIEDRSKFGSAHDYSRINKQVAEEYLLSQFKRAAHHFIEGSMVPKDNDILEWLALMQHYGTPTRLLDFTRSPYVACFFALEELAKNTPDVTEKEEAAEKETKKRKVPVIEDCSIWAVDTLWLIEKSFPRIAENLLGYTANSLLDSKFMAKKFDTLLVKYRKPLVLPVVPPRSNPRLLVQQGLFLCSSLVEGDFQDNLKSYQGNKDMYKHVYKIIIEGRIRTEVLSELRLMNISRASLFPGLEGYAASLAHEIEYRASEEIERLK